MPDLKLVGSLAGVVSAYILNLFKLTFRMLGSPVSHIMERCSKLWQGEFNH